MGKQRVVLALIIIAAVIAAISVSIYIRQKADISEHSGTPTTKMMISSPAFDDGGKIPQKFSCDGGNINPELLMQNVPADAKSLALIVDDPDAPTGVFTHWVVWNIDAKTTKIKEESVPSGAVEGPTSTDKPGFVGPCPPPGKPHHYHFKLYALDRTLGIDPGSHVDEVRAAIMDHTLAEAELVGIYERGD